MELTNKFKKILNIGAVAFVGLFGVGLSLVANGVQLKSFEKQYHQVRADDGSYSLSAYELNNYTFTNFSSYASANATYMEEDIGFNISFKGMTTEYPSNINTSFMEWNVGTHGEYTISFYHTADDMDSSLSIYKFYLNVGATSFDSDLTIVITGASSTFINGVYSALDSDILANSSANNQSWLQEIVSLLTGGIVGIAGGVGTGVSTLVGDIFISNGALSTFGGVLVVFAGVSLAIGLCRWVMNFLTSLGAKK